MADLKSTLGKLTTANVGPREEARKAAGAGSVYTIKPTKPSESDPRAQRKEILANRESSRRQVSSEYNMKTRKRALAESGASYPSKTSGYREAKMVDRAADKATGTPPGRPWREWSTD